MSAYLNIFLLNLINVYLLCICSIAEYEGNPLICAFNFPGISNPKLSAVVCIWICILSLLYLIITPECEYSENVIKCIIYDKEYMKH